MVSCFISRIVILLFGTLYPAYASYKAVRTKNVKEYVKWMMYWIVFALFTCAETFTDLFLSFWFPFYYEIKIITVIYLLSPATKGSSILYRKFVHPVLIKREQEIDEYIAKAKEQGYHTMLNLGSKGVTYATSLIMQTAIKGGGGIVNQLKKSYSLGDLSEENHRRIRNSEDETDGQYDEDPRRGRRMGAENPRRTISNPNDAGLYFPEVDGFQRPLRPIEEHYYSQSPSFEEISSGYSSGDPLYYGVQKPRGDHLVRTASLGPASRVRTRATTKAGLPKRSSLSEGVPTWSAMEPHESQIESEFYDLNQSHSAPFLFPVSQFGNLLRPGYQQIFAQNQMLAFLGSQYPPPQNFEAPKPETPKNESVVISEIKTEEEPSQSIQPEQPDSNKEVIKDREIEVKVEVPDENKSERSGKYNKKPAPVPPSDGRASTPDSVLDDDLDFRTPNASPKLERKVIAVVENTEEEPQTNAQIAKQEGLLEVPKKGKSKNKKGEKANKKLHLPKISFSFWSQKGGKSSGSETSSVASVEATSKSEDKKDLEFFIPLKDETKETSKE